MFRSENQIFTMQKGYLFSDKSLGINTLIVLIGHQYTLNENSSYAINLQKLGIYYRPMHSINIAQVTELFNGMNIGYMLTRKVSFKFNGTLDENCEMGKFLISIGFDPIDFSSISPYPTQANIWAKMDTKPKMTQSPPQYPDVVIPIHYKKTMNDRTSFADALENFGLYYKPLNSLNDDQVAELIKRIDFSRMQGLNIIFKSNGTIDGRCQMARYLNSIGFDYNDFSNSPPMPPVSIKMKPASPAQEADDLIVMNGNEYNLNPKTELAASLAKRGIYYRAHNITDISHVTDMFQEVDLGSVETLNVIFKGDGTLDGRCQMARYVKSIGFDFNDFSSYEPQQTDQMKAPAKQSEELIILDGRGYTLNPRSTCAVCLSKCGMCFRKYGMIDANQYTEMFESMNLSYMQNLNVIFKGDGTLDGRCQMARYVKSIGFDFNDFSSVPIHMGKYT